MEVSSDARELDRDDLFYFPAFPAAQAGVAGRDLAGRPGVQTFPIVGGMSMLDFFAAAALSGLLAHPEQEWDPDLPSTPPPFDPSEPWRIAREVLNARPATPKIHPSKIAKG